MAMGIFISVLEIFRFGSTFIFRRIKFGGLIFMILQYIHIALLTLNDLQKKSVIFDILAMGYCFKMAWVHQNNMIMIKSLRTILTRVQVRVTLMKLATRPSHLDSQNLFLVGRGSRFGRAVRISSRFLSWKHYWWV